MAEIRNDPQPHLVVSPYCLCMQAYSTELCARPEVKPYILFDWFDGEYELITTPEELARLQAQHHPTARA